MLTLQTGATIDADLDTAVAQEVLDFLGVTAAPRAPRTPVVHGWFEMGRDGAVLLPHELA